MLAITGGKGGCGKTTTALGLAAALARRRRDVLVVDADRDMPNLHAMAGVERSPGLADLPDESVERVSHSVSATPGVSVVPAAPGTDADDVRAALARLRGSADSVLVDAPAGAGPAAVAPLRAADRALLVTTLAPASLEDTAKTAAMARELGTPVEGAVLSGAGVSATRTAESIHDRVATLLDCPVLERVPTVDTSTGDDAVLADERVAASYTRLAVATSEPNV